MIQLATYFDRNYLLQGLALYGSLERGSRPFRLWTLCLDDESERILRMLDLCHLRIITVDELLGANPQLERARTSRPALEFYYACTPWLVDFVRRETNNAPVGYVDADMFFFRSYNNVTERSGSVLLVPHRSGDAVLESKHGQFNVCLMHFAGDDVATRALTWWGESVLRSTRLGAGVWGDQKYLDELPKRFPGVRPFENIGAAVAPWHLDQYRIEQERDGSLFIDKHPLVAFHFARFLVLTPRLFIPIRRDWWIPRDALKTVYSPYIHAIALAYEQVRSVNPRYRVGYMGHNRRGALFGLAAGRAFYKGRRRLHRVGVFIPSSGREMRGWLNAFRRPSRT